VPADGARAEEDYFHIVSCVAYLGGKAVGPIVELVARCLEGAWSRARKTPSPLPVPTNSGRATVVLRHGLAQGCLCRAEICAAAARAIDPSQ
jgi:hypothetical protein